MGWLEQVTVRGVASRAFPDGRLMDRGHRRVRPWKHGFLSPRDLRCVRAASTHDASMRVRTVVPPRGHGAGREREGRREISRRGGSSALPCALAFVPWACRSPHLREDDAEQHGRGGRKNPSAARRALDGPAPPSAQRLFRAPHNAGLAARALRRAGTYAGCSRTRRRLPHALVHSQNVGKTGY